MGLLIAISLSLNHTQQFAHLPEALEKQPSLVTAAVIFYHLIAAFIVLKVPNSSVGGAIMAVDALMGAVLTYVFGPPYLVLGFTLPVLETATYLGSSLGLAVLLIGGAFYGLISGLPLLEMLKSTQDKAAVIFQLNLAGIQCLLSALLLWLLSLVGRERYERFKLEVAAGHEKQMLFEEIQLKTKEVGEVFGEVGDREERLAELEVTSQQMLGKLEEMAEELHQARAQKDSLETVITELEHRLASTSRKERQSAERELAGMRESLKQNQAAIEQLNQTLEFMRELDSYYRVLHQSLHLSDTLLAITQHLQELLPSQTCVIFLLDEVDGSRELFAEVAASPYTDMFRNLTLQLNEGAPGYCASQRRSLKIDNGAVAVEGGVELPTLLVYEKSALVAPLATGGDVLGAIYLGRPNPGQYRPEEMELLQEYCQVASAALANSLLYQRTITGGLNDPLTHLYNGLYLNERTREEVMRGRRYTYPVSQILLSLDRFEEIQAALGQEICEQILKDVAEIIRQATRETDIPARLEGADFAVLLVHSDRNNAYDIGERIRAAIHARPFGNGPAKVSLTASVGVAGVPHDATNEEQLQQRVEAAIGMSRSSGGNAVSFWNGQRTHV